MKHENAEHTPVSTVSLNDKWDKQSGRVYITGSQALARLPMLQADRDKNEGLKTAGFISGYRGSPLGNFDKTLWQIRDYLKKSNITFQPGVNEDLGATAVWGSQQVNVFEGAKYDGVFGLWYGKGPGVDRTGDVFKHANAFGTTPYGGVLAIAGDDHASKSSTLPHQSDYAFMDAMMPVLYPSGIQEMLDFGLYGWAMSRFSGCWVGMKALAEVMDSAISADLNQDRLKISVPDDFELPADGLNARWPDKPLQQEERLHRYKIRAAQAFCRHNKLDKTVIDSEQPRLGIVTTGKSYLDVLQAFEDLGISHELASEIGIRLYKVAMPWPLEPEGIFEFAEGLDEILVIEEKRPLIEDQLKEQLYSWQDRSGTRPLVLGKKDPAGSELLTSLSELTPAMIARAIASRMSPFHNSDTIQQRLAFLSNKEAELEQPRALVERTPHFCSGCPHNSSTVVPEGSRALGGIGCHYMATWMDRGTDTFTQMGGEGATWIGQEPFTENGHVFQNLGDGTYFHSGLLAIRAAVAAGSNITYKVLYNDAVAMTGGQPIDGQLTVQQISHQLYGEGIRRIALISDEPDKYPSRADFADGVTFHHRDDLQAVQMELRDIPGCTAMIYDQTCAAEKRRRRKRGQMADPDKRVVINSEICEGCGDCGVQSNCLSLLPKETERGRKREIDQSACNKDFSCVRGFCPSFVTVKGGKLRKPAALGIDSGFPELPEPSLPVANQPYNILLTGVGGTGVVTVSALLGMAAHVEGKGAGVLDQIGLAQKFGAVMSHIRIAPSQEQIHTVRIPAGETDLMIGFDLMVGASEEALGKLDRERSQVVINNHETMPAAFTRDPDLQIPTEAMEQVIKDTARQESTYCLDASTLATKLMGDGMAINLFCIGFAWQKGLIPLQRSSIEEAIRLNGVAVQANLDAFMWGRRGAFDLNKVKEIAEPSQSSEVQPLQFMPSLEELVEREKQHLTAYQNDALANRYADLIRKVSDVEKNLSGTRLSAVVAENYSKVLAYKDEYEVARQLSSDSFREQLEAQFEGDFQLEFNLAPPLLSKVDPATGRPKKRTFSAKYLPLFKALSQLKGLRGTALDIFAYSADRRMERRLIREYESDINTVLTHLTRDNLQDAIQLLSLPAKIRGYGPVKDRAYEKAQLEREALLERISDAQPQSTPVTV
ncbi:indolepyruvate ferredoxin oxidoreductase family protein [Neptuniibacter caesariensis]|uniref:2-oxoacid:ferredoxin/flavodoxin oxidoreductase subunit family protein n=1 Tax=Neptuniibacter caesariensis TaxID=207954 RepID=A0A7U8C703_NEPCE|nr:indolepyruvate ferredoxin oxidoreductase family protein [Neptuniibacter caesariensis]EAR61039.1 2-oxoacid:ferredoxin/flavodoxin oxidoreductase subunit family protein [Neptuniibacter caesariensis]